LTHLDGLLDDGSATTRDLNSAVAEWRASSQDSRMAPNEEVLDYITSRLIQIRQPRREAEDDTLQLGNCGLGNKNRPNLFSTGCKSCMNLGTSMRRRIQSPSTLLSMLGRKEAILSRMEESCTAAIKAWSNNGHANANREMQPYKRG
jgi:hypothetical protein